MTDLRGADRRARRRAQEEFIRPLVLEAGAGTGKTTTLVARVLAWCLGTGWEKRAAEMAGESRTGAGTSGAPSPESVAAAVLRRVVAITFTEAAAAEMAGRIAEELAHVAAGDWPVWLSRDSLPGPGDLEVRARSLAGALDHLTVRTIHAFCRSLLADHPLEARLHPHFEVDATGIRVEEVCREVVEGALRKAYGDPADPDFLVLAARGIGPEEVVSALLRWTQEGISPEILAADPLAARRRRRLRRRCTEAVGRAAAAAGPLAGAGKRNRLTLETVDSLERTHRLLESSDGEEGPLEAWIEALPPLWPENVLTRLGDWARGRFNKGEQAVLGSGEGALPAAAASARGLLRHLMGLDLELLRAARRVLYPLLLEVAEVLRRQGVMTFSALLVEAGNLLAGNPGVRRRLRRRLDQLLVDEFQDTDRLQCDLVRRLSLEGPEDERPGLFLVGDPKQSIYGWRSADLEAYDAFLAEVRQQGGEVHGLSENFRSVPAILEEVERCIAGTMHEVRGLQPAFQPLFASPRHAADPGFVAGGRRPVEAWVSWGEEGSRTLSSEATALEAEALARDLSELHGTGVAWRDVGILLRSSGELDVYLEALRSAGIPFAVGRDKQYYQRREIIDAVALVRTVLDPGDQLALLTLLRSVLVGVPDAALLPLWSAGLPRRMIDLDLAAVETLARQVAADLPQGIPGLDGVAGWEENLISAAAALERLRKAFREDSAAEFVALLRRLFLQEALESARYLGRYRIANLERFYRQLQEGLESGEDVTGLLRFLRRNVREATAAEEGRLLDSAADAVQVLTIHGAKGLGFEHVYLPQLHKADPPSAVPDLAFGTFEGQPEYTLFGAPTLGFEGSLEAVREREAAERVRLLYVALTRAKRRLVMIGRWPEAPKPRPVAAARSMLDLLASRQPAVGDLGDLARKARREEGKDGDPSGRVCTDAQGLRWVFPRPPPAAAEASQPGSPGAGEEDGGARLASLEEVQQDMTRLRALRRGAAERMARPLAGRPSGSKGSEVENAPGQADQGPGDGLRWPAGPGGGEGAPAPSRGDGLGFPQGASDRRIAMAAGTAVHRALENLDLEGDPEAELAHQREALERYLPASLPPADRPGALGEAQRILGHAAAGRLLRRLFELAEEVLARELPVLLPPADDGGGPVAFVSGVIDLLYRDPATDRLVIADFKTDALETPEEVSARAETYAAQGAVYQEAVAGAFDLDHRPRFELWFLAVDRVIEIA